ncbi:MAG: hypothetical protein J6F30_08565 [Cellulosilyticum sp.]|nr:hypothetical protein [Cellulosilyticum sp.]
MKLITVRCEKCKKNALRLFDISPTSKGLISIKCSKCGEVNEINIEEYIRIHTEQIGAR